MSTRKNICVQYETGGTVKRNGKTYPETKLLTVGSAFVDEASGRVNGQFRAIPTGNWDGRFVLLDPLPRPSAESPPDDENNPY